jgi:hypothetical protein
LLLRWCFITVRPATEADLKTEDEVNNFYTFAVYCLLKAAAVVAQGYVHIPLQPRGYGCQPFYYFLFLH